MLPTYGGKLALALRWALWGSRGSPTLPLYVFFLASLLVKALQLYLVCLTSSYFLSSGSPLWLGCLSRKIFFLRSPIGRTVKRFYSSAGG